VSTTSTKDLVTARAWALELWGESHPVHFFLSPPRFVRGERADDSMSVTLSGEQYYGLGFGVAPPVNAQWTRCSIDQSHFGPTLGRLVANDRWDFYSVDVSHADFGDRALVLDDDAVITRILSEHAPHSQVWPGNKEIVNWYGVQDGDGQWASLGALVRWESGCLVISSVVTVSDWRGQGFAQLLTRGIVGEARRLGAQWIGLGVAHDNLAAQHTYEHSGFFCRANFTSYALL
jgi:ribosomal protein S18 acetylase RimI-like enzyme